MMIMMIVVILVIILSGHTPACCRTSSDGQEKEDCSSVSVRTVYVCDPFSGPVFDRLVAAKRPILGPPAGHSQAPWLLGSLAPWFICSFPSLLPFPCSAGSALPGRAPPCEAVPHVLPHPARLRHRLVRLQEEGGP